MDIALIWNEALVKPILNVLLFFNFYTASLGVSLIILTIIIKLILFPLNIPAIKMQYAKKKLDSKLKDLKEKYPDKTEFAKAQMELFKEHGINPASGCLPLILQLLVIFALLNVFNLVLKDGGVASSYVYLDFLKNPILTRNFLYLDLFKPDPYYILPLLSGVAQYFVSRVSIVKPDPALVAKKETDKKGGDDMQQAMEKQMLYMSPILTAFFGFSLPSGIVLYWFVSTVFSYFQTVIIKKFIKA
ncbi:membrane protein insertase YidC [Patescibacteria group bacterium]|nr:membrane protein insertase YidC [Patescibacteria group bacterium]